MQWTRVIGALFLGFQLQFAFAGEAATSDAPATPSAVAAVPLNGQACALKMIVASAKNIVAKKYSGATSTSGLNPTAVSLALQEAKTIPTTSQGFGNGIDWKVNLPHAGFVPLDSTDVAAAPAGSVIIVAGPHSDEYLKNHLAPRDPKLRGEFYGDVSIKGDDSKFYGDSKRDILAMGWVGNVNRDHVRNVAAILVPGPDIAREFEGKCK